MTTDSSRARSPFDFAPLSECPDAILQVAHWWCDEWGLPERHKSMDAYVGELASLTPGELPFHLLAVDERKVLGVATLKDRSALQELFPDARHWVSGVYVPPERRHRGIATSLCLKLVEIARTRGIRRLHLVTEMLDGGLYAKIGWKPIGQVQVEGVDLLVMAREVA
jgi:GNAT superfamily N-acetyltransferase